MTQVNPPHSHRTTEACHLHAHVHAIDRPSNHLTSEMRTFIDTSGVRWDVWEVRRDHVAGFGLTHHPVAPELQDGWLCFASARERRRLAPFPDDWRRLSIEQLTALCERAEPVPAEGTQLDFSRVPPPGGSIDRHSGV